MGLPGARGFRRRGRALAAAGGAVALVAPLLVLAGFPAGVASASPGSLDPTFGSGGAILTPDGQAIPDTEATGVAVMPNGDFAVSLGGGGSTSRFAVSVYGVGGNLVWSQTVDSTLSGSANAVAVRSGGNVVAVGYEFPSGCSYQVPVAVEYTQSGGLVSSYRGSCPSDATGISQFTAVAVSAPNTVVAAGNVGATQAIVDWIDASSSSGTVTATQTSSVLAGVNAVTLSGTDAIVGGSSGGAAKLGAFGTGGVDTGFGSAGFTSAVSGQQITGLTIGPSGNLVAVSNTHLAELTSAGMLVWQQPTAAWANAVAYQPFGGLIYVGGTSGSGVAEQMFIEQFNAATGAIIGAFGSAGVMRIGFAGPSFVAGLAPQGDGKVLAAGGIPYQTQGNTQAAVVRVYGPSLSVQTPAIVETSHGGPVPVNFTATIDEPLPGPVNAGFCLQSVSDSVNGGGMCNIVQIPAGAQVVNVPVNVYVTNPYGETFDTLSAQDVNGLAPSLTNGSATAIVRPVPSYPGYELVASDGGIFNYGGAPFYGSEGGQHLNAPIVGMASALFGDYGYYLVASDGGVFTFGPVPFYGSHGGQPLNKPIVGMAMDPATGGYWLVASDGGIFNYNAPYFGSTGGRVLNKPIVGMASTPDGGGYWLVASDGGIFNFGDAAYLGSHGGSPLNAPIVGMAANPVAQGYWLVGSDGGIFTYGNAPFAGSEGGAHLNKPVVGMAPSSDGGGYWLVASDGGIFNFGDATYQGSHGGSPLNQPIVGMSR